MATKQKKSKSVPGATIRGTYNTYEDMKRRDLVKALGHVVDLDLEEMLRIEVGGWGTGLRLLAAKGVKVTTEAVPDGRTKLYLTRSA